MTDSQKTDFRNRTAVLGDLIQKAHGIEARVFFKGMTDALMGADEVTLKQPDSWPHKRIYKLGYVAAMQVTRREDES